MIARIVLLGMILAGMFLVSPAVLASSASPTPLTLAERHLSELPTGHVDAYLQQINQASAGYLPGLSFAQVLTSLGRGGMAPGSILKGLINYLFREVVNDMSLLGKILILTVGCAILVQLGQAFQGEEVARLAQSVAFIALLGLAFASFAVAVRLAHTTVSDLTGLMTAQLPLLTTLLVGSGAIATAALFHPLLLVAVNSITWGVADLVLPLIFLAVLTEIVGQLTGYRLDQLAALLRQVGMWSMGLGLTLFLGLAAIYGSVGPVTDGLTLRTSKFMAATFVPVVGKMFADAAEMVFGSSLLLKQAVGVVGVLAVLFLVLMPLIKILALAFIYRLAGAVAGPVGAGPVADSLGSMGAALTLVAVALGAAGLMFFISITILFSAGNPGLLP